MNWKLTPSDFSLFENCMRCFYLKVRGLLVRPGSPNLAFFRSIDSVMRAELEGRRTEAVAIGMPPGIFDPVTRWARSKLIQPDQCKSSFYIQAAIQNVFRLDEGGVALVDVRVGRRGGHVAHRCQLHAQAWALEQSAVDTIQIERISRLGVLTYEPQTFTKGVFWSAFVHGDFIWNEISRDDEMFLARVTELINVLEIDETPAPSEACRWCHYRAQGYRADRFALELPDVG